MRPRLKDYLKWNDIYTDESTFPVKFRILANEYFDMVK